MTEETNTPTGEQGAENATPEEKKDEVENAGEGTPDSADTPAN